MTMDDSHDVQPGMGTNDIDDNRRFTRQSLAMALSSASTLSPKATGLLIDPFGVPANPGIGHDVVTTRQSLDRPKVRKFVDWMLRVAFSQVTWSNSSP
jgi:DNA-binding transcriptional LysR family regulator